MDSFWPVNFEAANLKTPKEILEGQMAILPKLTKNLVYADLEELNEVQKIKILPNGFQYSFVIRGNYLENYKFKVFSMSHDIIFYPVSVFLDNDIKTELEMSHLSMVERLHSEEEFTTFLKKVLKSKKVSTVIGSIIKLSPTIGSILD